MKVEINYESMAFKRVIPEILKGISPITLQEDRDDK